MSWAFKAVLLLFSRGQTLARVSQRVWTTTTQRGTIDQELKRSTTYLMLSWLGCGNILCRRPEALA